MNFIVAPIFNQIQTTFVLKMKSSFLPFFILFAVGLYAQQDIQLIDNELKIEIKQRFTDEQAKSFLDSLVDAGYYQLKVDSIVGKENAKRLYFTKGKNFKVFQVSITGDSLLLFPKVYQKKLQTDSLAQVILKKYEEEGFPFAVVTIQKKDENRAEIIISPNKKRYVDALVVEGNTNLPKAYVGWLKKNFQGKVYSPKLRNELSETLKREVFIEQHKTPQVAFLKDSTLIFLYPERRKSSSFEGMLGFGNDPVGKFRLNGDLSLHLANVFGGFEHIHLAWRSTPLLSQEIKVELQFPFVYKHYIGSDTRLNIYRQDSTFVNFFAEQKLFYNISRYSRFGLLGGVQSSAFVEGNATNFPLAEDFSKWVVGAFYEQFNPTGILLYPYQYYFYTRLTQMDASYTSETLKQYGIELRGSYLKRLWNKNYLYFSTQNQVILSDKLVPNELMRIGGINSIRGFAEDQFFADVFAVQTLEYRFIPNQQVFFSAFVDYAYVQNKPSALYQHLVGTGLGMNFLSKIGVLSIQFALGKFPNQPVDWNAARVHVGVRARL